MILLRHEPGPDTAAGHAGGAGRQWTRGEVVRSPTFYALMPVILGDRRQRLDYHRGDVGRVVRNAAPGGDTVAGHGRYGAGNVAGAGTDGLAAGRRDQAGNPVAGDGRLLFRGRGVDESAGPAAAGYEIGWRERPRLTAVIGYS